MPERPPVGFGDVVTVLGKLGLLDGGSDEDARRVARVLGVGGAISAAPAPAPVVERVPAAAAGGPDSESAEAVTPVGVAPAAAAVAEADVDGAALAFTIGARSPLQAPRLRAPPLPPPADDDEDDVRPPLEPLFSPASSRSLVAAIASTWQTDGPVDVAALVDRVARRRPVVRVPRRRRLGVRQSVQVLVDYGPGFDPFARDAAALIAQLRTIAGSHCVQVRRFATDPRIAGPGPRPTWRDYHPPAGARVIALTDLGIAAPQLRLPSPEQGWETLAARVADGRGSLLCVVPYPPERWPPALARALTIVPWDRTTTVGHARMLLRRRR